MNRLTIQFRLPLLLGRVAHGVHHMRPVDLTVRAVLAVACFVGAAWMITQGALVWPLVVGVVGALSLAIDAVELYAAAIVCERMNLEEWDR
ncbi:hypothetical protein [Nocardiopsis tropica]|jgi:hypothetical protein|uniref:Uncharacterized protein n=1 Tax=Nocardiopsis tropica TaxID=109330 RepID=A0ABU7L1N2_9ACTN|nr:hypothetical protein [Nocardiopsis umidischolae]MEE2055472.1 hypothetical protein [Nocardiopsis umidischolae]